MAEMLASPPVGPVAERVPERDGTGPPYVMEALFSIAVTESGMIVQIPKLATDPALIWVMSRAKVPETESLIVAVPTFAPTELGVIAIPEGRVLRASMVEVAIYPGVTVDPL